MDAAVAQEVSHESAAQKLLDLVTMATPGSRAAKGYRLEFTPHMTERQNKYITHHWIRSRRPNRERN